MVLGLLASAVTSLAAYAFPTFASYKAIKANDSSQMIPWLMFWSVQACVLFLEHWCYMVIQWIPLYREAKMILMLWMVLPQTQGAQYLYLHYVHPNIAEHENDLDRLLIGLHEQIRSRGGQYLEIIFAKITEILFGPQIEANRGTDPSASDSQSTTTVSSTGGASYIASLFSRFRTVPVGSGPESLPSSLLSFLNYSSNRGEIIPANLTGDERARYVAQQKAKLQEWLQLLEAAEQSYPSINLNSPRIPPAEAAQRRNRRQATNGMTSRSPSGMASRSPSGMPRSVSGLRTPGDSDYEDLGADEYVRKQSVSGSPERAASGNWFWKSK